MKKLILDTELCKIYFTGKEYEVFILSERAGWIEHHPFEGDLKGLINALDLSMNVLSGKFWLRGLSDMNKHNVENARLEFRDGSKKD